MIEVDDNVPHVYVVEHLDPELESWSALEYQAIAEESEKAGVKFCLSSVSKGLVLPVQLVKAKGLKIEHRSVEELFEGQKDRVCLLDPAAKAELSPDDGDHFCIFLFGGILGRVNADDNTEWND